ncbi:hypothetical protein J4461_04010 [Candidatus Pacearchaeota archaeon]|nr:hypothetical protein [Candidatus Pacearchaeota archaeon]
MNFSFILIGSTHSFVDDFLKQEEIIKSVKPEFVLSEELENLKLDTEDKVKEILEKKFISDMTSFDEVEKLIKLCFEKKIKLIGIDFHNFGFDENLQRKIKNQKELIKEDEERLNKIVEEREKLHLSKILEYKSKTKRPLVIILGCWHLRENSLLRKKLKNYKIIAPLDENGGVLFEPNNSEIKYGEIISNEE